MNNYDTEIVLFHFFTLPRNPALACSLGLQALYVSQNQVPRRKWINVLIKDFMIFFHALSNFFLIYYENTPFIPLCCQICVNLS